MPEREYTEEEIQDLTDRVFLLRQQLEAGKMHFAAHLVDDFRRSYEAIRLRSDGRVDPTTVDGRIRAATLAVRVMKDRSDAKAAISLGDIQEAYFNFLFRQFGWLFDRMIKAGVGPSQAARAMMKDEGFLKQLKSGLPGLASELRDFWDAAGDPGAYHLQDGDQLKATFAGDLFPAPSENAVSTAGLYIDTIVLPCPVTRIAPLLGVAPDEEVARLLVKHTLTAMTYREVATAAVTPPIALILPSPDDVDREMRKGLVSRAEPAMLKHGSYLFGRQFESLADLGEFCSDLQSVEDVAKELKGGDRLLFDTEWDPNPITQLSRAMAERQSVIPGFDPSCAGHHVLGTCYGRMPQALAAQENATHFRGTPLINADTSWRYYTWLLEYESLSAAVDLERSKGAHIARALSSEADQNLAWLGNVPPSTVIEIRKRGLAPELRKMLSAGVGELIQANPGSYFRTADQVVENLDRAFRDHQRALLEARQKKLQLYGVDVGSFVATGAIAVTAALTSSPALGALSGLLGISGLPNLKDLKSRFKAQAEEDRARQSSPTGLLFKHVRRRN